MYKRQALGEARVGIGCDLDLAAVVSDVIDVLQGQVVAVQKMCIRDRIGSARLSFAPEEQLWELLHCTPGSATILGLMNDDENRVQLLLDKETYEAEYFSCHPCRCV